MEINKPIEIPFGDIKHNYYNRYRTRRMSLCIISYLGQWMSQIQIKLPAIFTLWCARKKDFVAANIAAVNLPLSVFGAYLPPFSQISIEKT